MGPSATGIPGARWDSLDRAWTNERFAFRAVEPYPFNIIAVAGVWSCSTPGRIQGPAIRVDVHSFTDLQRFAGQLKGAFLLLDPARGTPAHFEPQAERLTGDYLQALGAGQRLQRLRPTGFDEVTEFRYNVRDDSAARHWLVSEGVSALLYTAPGDGGTIFQEGPGGGFQQRNTPDEIPVVKVSAESYGRIVRILEKNLPVMLELDMQNTFYDRPELFNVIAEIPGTDPKLKEEVVMIGAQLDSWTYGTGATDNAAGAAVTMEAMRVLKTLNVRPRRTIRAALTTGHEQGSIGASAYVAQHFGDGTAAGTRPEFERFSVYFYSGGYGKSRGVFQKGNAAAGPIFEVWMEPFRDMGMKTVTMLGCGMNEYSAFTLAGLPGFAFVEDPLEMDTRTHHSNADVYERFQPEDLKFNSAVVASFAWQAAQRDEKMPRMTPPR